MDDGIDAESRSSQDAPRPGDGPTNVGGQDAAEDNKFQKAIGAWRSRSAPSIHVYPAADDASSH
jgi:homeobox protein cut-like